VRPLLDSSVKFWAPKCKQEIKIEYVQRWAIKVVKGVERTTCKEWVRILHLFSLE